MVASAAAVVSEKQIRANVVMTGTKFCPSLADAWMDKTGNIVLVQVTRSEVRDGRRVPPSGSIENPSVECQHRGNGVCV
jgi:hypothetical protein